MAYDFDTPVERRGTDSLKYDLIEQHHPSGDLMPLWVADMDFRTAPEIVDAVLDRTRHGIFGYTQASPEGYLAVMDSWHARRYGWHVPPEQVTLTPGVVFALATAVRTFTQPGDAVMVQRPVYHPFMDVALDNGRTLVDAPLKLEGMRYSIDFEAFERTAADNNVKLFLLCNPHNPVGRVWSPGELRRLGEICLRLGITVLSDEIHMDFARPGFTHTPFATVDPAFAQNAVICTSVSKTFNLAGLQLANVVIADKEKRRAFRDTLNRTGYGLPNTLGLVAAQAAYEHGEAWLEELKAYLEGNWKLLRETLEERAPQLHLIPAESTYLAWIDCRELGLDPEGLQRFIEDEAGLWLNQGTEFGAGGEGFVRLNIATQRAYLAQALDQLCSALEKRG